MEATNAVNITKLSEFIDEQRQAEQLYEQARRVIGQRLISFQSEGANPGLDEPGWKRAGADGAKIGDYTREEVNAMSWHYFRNDPMFSHAVNLHNSYTFGRGVTVQANDERVQPLVNSFWQDQLNRNIIARPKALYERNAERINNGEQFWALYVSKSTGSVRVRTINPREIKTVVYANNDQSRPMSYLREFTPQRFDAASGKYIPQNPVRVYLPDYRNASAGEREQRMARQALGLDALTEIYMLHDLANPFEGRGVSLFSTSIPWLRAFKGFMEDRATIQIAASLFAYKAKIAGNQAAVDRVLSQFGTYEETANRYGTGQWRERRQGGNVWAENNAMSLEQFKFDTGASNAYTDARMLRQMVGVGALGLFEHYLAGDASTGNLATATAMELPMLKIFEYQQEYWRNLLSDLFWFVLVKAAQYGRAGSVASLTKDLSLGTWELAPAGDVDLTVNIEFPDIVQKDVPMLMSAIAGIASAEAVSGERMMTQRRKSLTVLSAIGVDNPTAEVDEMLDENPTVNAPQPQMPPPTQPQAQPEEEQPAPDQQTESVARTQEVVGMALPDGQAVEVEPFTKDDLDATLRLARRLPDFETLLKLLGVTEDEVDD